MKFPALGLALAAVLTLPAAAAELTDGPLKVSAELPEQVRVGDEFTYDVVVTNTSGDLTLHDVKIKQTPGDRVSIEQTQQKQAQQNNNQNSNEQNQQASSGQMISIARLDPGQSKTVSVKAAADQQGQGQICLRIEGYTPALCLGLNATKPELELAKTAPEQVNLCEPFVYTYTFKNSGTGDVDGITLTDELPEGILTIAGEKSLSFDVDNLATGDSRAFEANVMATRTGTFATRAMAKAGENLESRSASPQTRVVAPKVALKLEAPEQVYLDTPAQYKLIVSNMGDAPALDTQVDVAFPGAAGFARVSDIRNSSAKIDAGNAEGNKAIAMVRPTFAKTENGKMELNAKKQGGRNMLALDDEEGFDFGTIEPGESKEITFSMTPEEQGVYRQIAQVSYYCAIGEEVETAQARLSAEAYGRTEVIALPALLLAAYDNEEKNRGDGQITYRIVVKNQGEAEDTNLTVKATLPEGLKFVAGEGPTDVSADGRNINIGKVNTIRPGDRLEWEITTEVEEGAGDVRFNVEMNADSLDSPATAQEPTRLLDLAAQN